MPTGTTTKTIMRGSQLQRAKNLWPKHAGSGKWTGAVRFGPSFTITPPTSIIYIHPKRAGARGVNGSVGLR
jgi:hypothetical protein